MEALECSGENEGFQDYTCTSTDLLGSSHLITNYSPFLIGPIFHQSFPLVPNLIDSLSIPNQLI